MGVVVAVFAIFYGITAFINSRPEKEESEVVSETIQYKEILVGQMLNRIENNYYVLVEAAEDVYNDLYITYLETYISGNEDANYYTVNLEDVLNQHYLGDATIVKGQNISEYRFSETTLVQVKKGKIAKVYTTQDEILSALKKLVK